MKRWKFDHKRSVGIYRNHAGDVCKRTVPRYYTVTTVFRISGYDADMNEGDFVVESEDDLVIV